MGMKIDKIISDAVYDDIEYITDIFYDKYVGGVEYRIHGKQDVIGISNHKEGEFITGFLLELIS